jgi:rare lipoprotein A (peptidoglycan hydrolase)
MRPMLALIFAATFVPAPAAAQFYAPSWNTTVLAVPAKPSGMTTSSLTQQPSHPTPSGIHAMKGLASYYWQPQMTSSGERFDKNAMTAAHRTLPLNSKVKVTHVESGRSVVVRINDRGPFKPGRVVDLSDRAAEILGFKAHGLAHVKMELVR